MAIGFPMRRSHQLIATPIAPLAAPVCRPRLVVSLGPRASARFSFYRSARFISSSRHLVLFSCCFYRHPVGACPIHGGGLAAGAGNWDGGGIFFMRRFPQLIIVRPVIRFSSSGAASDRCGFDGAVSTVPSHHLIPSPSCSVSPAVSSHASRLASRPHIPGHQRGREGRSKQANTQNWDEKPGSKTGRRTERGRQDNGKRKNGTRTMASKAGEGATGTCGNHAQEQNAPHSFSPDPLAAGSHLFAGLN